MKTDQLVSWPTILVLIAMALCQDPGARGVRRMRVAGGRGGYLKVKRAASLKVNPKLFLSYHNKARKMAGAANMIEMVSGERGLWF